MSNELIERLAREAGGDREELRLAHDWIEQQTTFDDAALARFAALVAEQCAQAARGAISSDTDWDTSYWNQAVECAAGKARAAFPMPKD